MMMSKFLTAAVATLVLGAGAAAAATLSDVTRAADPFAFTAGGSSVTAQLSDGALTNLIGSGPLVTDGTFPAPAFLFQQSSAPLSVAFSTGIVGILDDVRIDADADLIEALFATSYTPPSVTLSDYFVAVISSRADLVGGDSGDFIGEGQFFQASVAAIPIPAGGALLLAALIGLSAARRRSA